MVKFGKRKDGRAYPKKSRGIVLSNAEREDRARRRETIRSRNYDGGDYIGPNPSRRSRQLDRAHRSKQPWEKRRRR